MDFIRYWTIIVCFVILIISFIDELVLSIRYYIRDKKESGKIFNDSSIDILMRILILGVTMSAFSDFIKLFN